MKLFRIISNPQGIDRMEQFLKDNFVSIGYPGLGDLENVGKDELKDRLAEAYDYQDRELTGRLEEIISFVHIMQDGDYELVADTEFVYLGDLGDYY